MIFRTALFTAAVLLSFGVSAYAANNDAAPAKRMAGDADGDNRLTLNEYQNMNSHVFDRLDKDDDGQMTPEEKNGKSLEAGQKLWGDKDGNGALSKSEFLATGEINFNKLDKDKDGFVSAQERYVTRASQTSEPVKKKSFFSRFFGNKN
jgi:hypothetical protein